jgi:inhibitor of KinA
MSTQGFSRFRAVADRAVLVEFGERIADDIHAAVLRLDRLLTAHPLAGVIEAVPAYASLLVTFDPLVTDHHEVENGLRDRLQLPDVPPEAGRLHDVAVCYDRDLGSDLAEAASMTGKSEEEVIAAHLAGTYRVYMYGFAPGYAYLAGVPPALQLPRKPVALRDVPAGRVIIAGAQCIVTTLKMPTGWWIVGASPTRILTGDPARPFLFDVGDRVRFRRVSRGEFDAL